MKRLAQGAITTGGGTTLYTTPTGIRTEVLDIHVANTSSGVLSCSLHLVPTGASAATTNMLFPAIMIDPNMMVHWEGLQVLNAGDFIQGIGSASGLTLTISGNEYRSGT